MQKDALPKNGKNVVKEGAFMKTKSFQGMPVKFMAVYSEFVRRFGGRA